MKAVPSRYHVIGKEVGESGTPHLQGFVIFTKNYRMKGLKKLCARAHWEITQGTSQQARDYITNNPAKPDPDYEEIGVISEQGKRNDLSAATDMIKQGRSMQELAEEHPETFVKFGRGLRDLALTLQTPYDHDKCRGLWIYGPPGSGKSHTARELFPDAFLKSQSKWWDGYAMQDSIILDDLDTAALGHYLKIWTDKYACTGETKGGTVALQHKHFVITSNYSPEELFKEDAIMAQALERRCKVVYKANRGIRVFVDDSEEFFEPKEKKQKNDDFQDYCLTGKITP